MSIELEVTEEGAGKIFEDFYAAYERAFVLPDEMEDRDGFRKCLELNHGMAYDSLSKRYGQFRELCIVARDASMHQLIGGANLIAVLHDGHNEERKATVNLNYIFVEPDARGKGWLRKMLLAITDLVCGIFEGIQRISSDNVFIFVEQNDPLMLSSDDYLVETEFSGIDQFDRLKIWASQGSLVIDFEYVQPALSIHQKPEFGLIYSVLCKHSSRLDCCLLLRHLHCFFGVSVMKGEEIERFSAADEQLQILQKYCAAGTTLLLLESKDALQKLDSVQKSKLIAEKSGTPMRAWLRDQRPNVS